MKKIIVIITILIISQISPIEAKTQYKKTTTKRNSLEFCTPTITEFGFIYSSDTVYGEYFRFTELGNTIQYDNLGDTKLISFYYDKQKSAAQNITNNKIREILNTNILFAYFECDPYVASHLHDERNCKYKIPIYKEPYNDGKGCDITIIGGIVPAKTKVSDLSTTKPISFDELDGEIETYKTFPCEYNNPIYQQQAFKCGTKYSGNATLIAR